MSPNSVRDVVARLISLATRRWQRSAKCNGKAIPKRLKRRRVVGVGRVKPLAHDRRLAGFVVYVVDDGPSAREGVARLIRSAGMAAETFASAQEFLAYPRQDIPSCLILDLHMPGLSGFDLQSELTTADVRLPIIFLTGRGDIPTSIRAIKAGVQEFLTKPFNDEVLTKRQNAWFITGRQALVGSLPRSGKFLRHSRRGRVSRVSKSRSDFRAARKH